MRVRLGCRPGGGGDGGPRRGSSRARTACERGIIACIGEGRGGSSGRTARQSRAQGRGASGSSAGEAAEGGEPTAAGRGPAGGGEVCAVRSGRAGREEDSPAAVRRAVAIVFGRMGGGRGGGADLAGLLVARIVARRGIVGRRRDRVAHDGPEDPRDGTRGHVPGIGRHGMDRHCDQCTVQPASSGAGPRHHRHFHRARGRQDPIGTPSGFVPIIGRTAPTNGWEFFSKSRKSRRFARWSSPAGAVRPARMTPDRLTAIAGSCERRVGSMAANSLPCTTGGVGRSTPGIPFALQDVR